MGDSEPCKDCETQHRRTLAVATVAGILAGVAGAVFYFRRVV